MAENKLETIVVKGVEYNIGSSNYIEDFPITMDSSIVYEDEIIFCETEEEPYVKISEKGITSKGYYDIDGNDILKNINNNSSDDYILKMFSKCICISDSITAGWRKESGDLKQYSYPETLRKMTGWDIVTNAATGGQTAAGWMSNSNYGGASSTDFSIYDIAIIFLGQNPETEESYRTNMQSIIDLLKSANPLMNIFMLKRSNSGKWNYTQEIADSNNIPCFYIYGNDASIDLSQEKYHKTFADNPESYDTVHFNTLGYNALGKVIYDFILKEVKTNFEKYKNLGDENNY